MARSSTRASNTALPTFEEIRIRDCSIKRALDVIGERWTLLVIREAFYGAHRFEEFFANVGCARTLLSDRLTTLVERGVLRREPYREPGQRERYEYYLTDKGQSLHLAMTVLKQWGDDWEAGPDGGPMAVHHRDCGAPIHVELRCAEGHLISSMDDTESGPRPGLKFRSTN